MEMSINLLATGFKVQGSEVQGSGFKVQPSRRPKKRPVKSRKKLWPYLQIDAFIFVLKSECRIQKEGILSILN